MMSGCPEGNTVSGTQPLEHIQEGERLRTFRLYDYPVQLSLNLTSLGAVNGLVSDRGPGFVVLQVFNCVAGLSGFCSPFVHEQTIARDIAAAIAFAIANPDPNRGPPPPWRYIPGDLHGGSHAHSGFVFLELPPDSGPIYTNVTLNIPQLIMVAGDYYTIVSLQFHLWEMPEGGGDPVLVRYDVANKLEGRQSLTYYFDPPTVLEVDPEVLCASYVFIGLSSALLLFLLLQTVKHMKHQVMKLSQGSFLAFFIFAGLVATVASFLFEPKNDAYCQASKPIVMISLQCLYAVTIGRLWRIHSLISPLLLKSLDTETPFQRLKRRFTESRIWRCLVPSAGNPRKIRTQVTERQLAILVALLVSPQVALQVLALILQPSERKIDFNTDESTGRATCDFGDMPKAESIIYWGYAVFMLLIVGLLVMAYQSRKLPSLFDESQKIFDATVTTFGILILGVAVILVTDDPETSPSVNYLVWVFVVLSITVNTTYRIIWPKLQMIWYVTCSSSLAMFVCSFQSNFTSSPGAERLSLSPNSCWTIPGNIENRRQRPVLDLPLPRGPPAGLQRVSCTMRQAFKTQARRSSPRWWGEKAAPRVATAFQVAWALKGLSVRRPNWTSHHRAMSVLLPLKRTTTTKRNPGKNLPLTSRLVSWQMPPKITPATI